jgi:hypothetical protein
MADNSDGGERSGSETIAVLGAGGTMGKATETAKSG